MGMTGNTHLSVALHIGPELVEHQVDGRVALVNKRHEHSGAPERRVSDPSVA